MSKRILVTGAATGIGKAIALRLAKDGFDIAVHCRSHIDAGMELVKSIQSMGRESSLLQFDVSDCKACEESLTQDIEKNGAYWGIVLNAGIARDQAFPAMDSDSWNAVINTNLGSFYNVLHPCIMPMIHLRDGGRIVTMSSVAGLSGNRGQTNYSASKAGIIAATESLAIELGKRKITVNSVAPGVIDTEMVPLEVRDQVLPMVPLNRLGTVDDVAGVVSFLCSKDAAYITKQVISVNGGMY